MCSNKRLMVYVRVVPATVKDTLMLMDAVEDDEETRIAETSNNPNTRTKVLKSSTRHSRCSHGSRFASDHMTREVGFFHAFFKVFSEMTMWIRKI